MRSAVWAGLALLFLTARPPESSESRQERAGTPRELVVLVHGMGRTACSMAPVRRALEAAGYEVLNHGYHSRRMTVAEAGSELAAAVATVSLRPEVTRVHFVGHSLGNIVIRWVLANAPPARLGRVVMLAPPNQGARLADRFAGWLSWLSQPLPDLTTASGSAARTLVTPAGVEIGVIAGSYDHTVRLEETFLAGQKERAVVPCGHTFIMRKTRVHQLAVRFLRDGTFGEAIAPPAPQPVRPELVSGAEPI